MLKSMKSVAVLALIIIVAVVSYFPVGFLEKTAEFIFTGIATFGIEQPDPSSPWIYVKTVAILVGFCGYYVLQIRPLNRVRKLGDVGYMQEGGYTIKETANLVQRQRKVGDVPPPFPNGWFALVESFCLKAGEVKSVAALGENFAVFRDEGGSAHVLDAYCPHLGANIAVGGRVVGDCIECPFHAWRFRGQDGKCVHIHYTDTIPDKARTKHWPSTEVSGWIFVWYHSDGCDPTWVIPAIGELESGALVYRGRTEHFINVHIEEIAENGADVTHINQIHGPLVAAGNDLRTTRRSFWRFAGHEWTIAWEPSPEPDGHVGCLKLTHALSLFGVLLPCFRISLFVRQLGPGLMYLEFDGFFGRGMFLMTITPQGPLCQRVVHHIHTNRWTPAFIAKIILFAQAIQIERDIMIWNNKRYEGRPLYVKSKEDTLLAKHRRWFSQFYSEKSHKYFQKEDLTF